ncbi:EpsG family protein [Selenomonas ruminantium]|uniref:EpsG family protein n=1 Tax=Selenomonas ruminantium TaxID=971 RepID=UPI0026EC085F|nr:EpsG family protein [Selenomonas ruminantium]
MNFLEILYFVLVAFNIVAVISGNRNNILALISFAFIMLFISGIQYNGTVVGYDLRNYELLYDDTELINKFEFGFKFINDIGNNIGLNFEQFRFALIFVCALAIIRVACQMNANLNLLIVAYLMYFIMPASVQLKNLCAITVFLQIFPIPNKITKLFFLKAFSLIMIAASIHFSFWGYIIFIFAFSKLHKVKKIYKVVFYVMLVITVILVLLRVDLIFAPIFNIITLALGDASDVYAKRYDTVTGMSSLVSVSLLVFSMLAIKFWRKSIYKVSSTIKNDCKKILVSRKSMPVFLERLRPFHFNLECIYNCVLLSSLFFPLLIVNATFYRLIRDVTLVVIFHLASNCNNRSMSVNKRMIILLFVLGICVGWFAFDIIIKGYTDEFFSNYFIDGDL